MYPIPKNEKLTEMKICKKCQTSFPITDKDLEFYDKVSPVFNGQKFSIPSPTLCPDCRQQRRLAFRNERKLYKRKTEDGEKIIVSMFSTDKKCSVCEYNQWWSDSWNPFDHRKNFDYSKTFSEQFGNLLKIVPEISLIQSNQENSQYTSVIILM